MIPGLYRVAEAGHNVTIFETSSLVKPRDLGSNINVVHIHIPTEKTLFRASFQAPIRSSTINMPYEYGNKKMVELLVSDYEKVGRCSSDNQFNASQLEVIEIINVDPPWDLLIFDELFGIHSYALALYFNRHWGIPYIVYSTTAMVQATAYALALGYSLLSLSCKKIQFLGRSFVAEPHLLTLPPIDNTDVYSPSSSFSARFDNVKECVLDIGVIQFYRR